MCQIGRGKRLRQNDRSKLACSLLDKVVHDGGNDNTRLRPGLVLQRLKDVLLAEEHVGLDHERVSLPGKARRMTGGQGDSALDTGDVRSAHGVAAVVWPSDLAPATCPGLARPFPTTKRSGTLRRNLAFDTTNSHLHTDTNAIGVRIEPHLEQSLFANTTFTTARGNKAAQRRNSGVRCWRGSCWSLEMTISRWVLVLACWSVAACSLSDESIDTDSSEQAATGFRKGGQDAFFHDEGNSSGFFHTYDRLSLGRDDAPRKVHVFVPRDYEVSGKSYPVIYMNDGDTAFFAGGLGKSWEMGNVLREAYAKKLAPEVIVVAVHSLAREREYTHVAWGPGRECCALDGYADYLALRLKPFIDSTYRTQRGSATTALVGSSHGGLAAFYTAMKHPRAFGTVVAMSSSFWVGVDASPLSLGDLAESELWRRTSRWLAAGARPRVYLDWGLVRSGGFQNSFVEAMATREGRAMAGLLRDRKSVV